MDYRRFENQIVLRLDRGDEIVSSIKVVAEKEQIKLASVTGIGATGSFTTGVFDMAKHDYNRFSYTGSYEITSLVGNINTMDGKSYTHLHMTCANESGNLIGGHLLECCISLTAEIFIQIIDGCVDRKRDPELQINTLCF